MRGCYIQNGIFVDGKELINFDEYSNNPVLKLCTRKK